MLAHRLCFSTGVFRAVCYRAVRLASTQSTESSEIVRQRDLRKSRQRLETLALATKGLPSFRDTARAALGGELKRRKTSTLQVNVGLLCNQTCHHCHVEAGPTRTVENMSREVVDRVIELMARSESVQTVDITGGAPELNPHFRTLVAAARRHHKNVIDRCNLTVLFEEGQHDTPEFLAANQVHVVASLPCYSFANVDKQRGKGVFDKSIRALQRLNELGYGRVGLQQPLRLSLVYNPLGASLPPPQQQLERAYRSELQQHFGIEFTDLFTVTNMPIKRFADQLLQTEQYTAYMQLLLDAFNAATLESLMCRDTVSVSWDGKLHDCDFNQMLQMRLGAPGAQAPPAPATVWELESLDQLEGHSIATGKHCYACTAGAGSSCTGALVS